MCWGPGGRGVEGEEVKSAWAEAMGGSGRWRAAFEEDGAFEVSGLGEHVEEGGAVGLDEAGAVDDGVVMATYLDQRFAEGDIRTKADVRAAVLDAGMRRIRPCLMTTATTILALLPVLTSTGKGADIMVPMAIPAFGGMVFELLTLFVVPVLYSWKKERGL